MPRTPLQFQQMKDERKLSILESALPLFAINGKNDVSIDMICQKAKCSHGLAYHYFKNVEQIYLELTSSDNYKNLKDSLDCFDYEKDVYSQIYELSKKLVEITKEPRFTVSFALIIISDDSKKTFYSNLIKLVQIGQKDGVVVAGKPADIVDAFLLIFKGLYQSILNQKHSVVRVPSIDNILKIILR